jgi:hypothetical protein
VLASSSEEKDLKDMLAALDADGAIDEVVSAGDVDEAKPSPEVLDVVPLGPAEGRQGEHEVLVRNRIESPVLVDLPAAISVAGVVARPVIDASTLAELRPQQTRTIVYRLDDPQATVPLVAPLLVGRPQPDFQALLRMLMARTGFESLGYTVTVRAADGTFTPRPEATEPLTGLLVEFDDGTRAELTPDAPSVQAALVGRIIDQLTGTADEQRRYLFRVTNVHPTGEGARTGWTEGFGEGEQVVTAAHVVPSPLDF